MEVVTKVEKKVSENQSQSQGSYGALSRTLMGKTPSRNNLWVTVMR